jgi:transcriptional regulator with XRE-family HTH domain
LDFFYIITKKGGDFMAIDLKTLKTRKKELGLSYDDLARLTGYSRSTITNIFLGYIEYPREETKDALYRVLGLSEEEPGYTEDEKEMFELIAQLTDEEAKQIWHFLEYLISKRQKK